MAIGSKNTLDDDFFDGLIDEVELSNINRSPAWILASYYSGNDGLLTLGPEEPEAPEPQYFDMAYSTTIPGASCEFTIRWTDPNGLTNCHFWTDNSGSWVDTPVTVS